MRGTIQMIEVGSELPEANLLRMGENGPETVSLSSLTNGRKIVLFGLPGAFTGTCTTAHVPSFIRVMDKLTEKEVAEVVCVTVNDVFVVDAWSESTGAKAAGMSMVADGDGSLTKAFGLDFDLSARWPLWPLQAVCHGGRRQQSHPVQSGRQPG